MFTRYRCQYLLVNIKIYYFKGWSIKNRNAPESTCQFQVYHIQTSG